MNRRGFFKWLGGMFATGVAFAGYAFAIEPVYRLRVKHYAFTPPRWTPGLKLKIACLADPHACEPYMSLARLERIVKSTNALKPDLILLLGDYRASHRFVTQAIDIADVVNAFTELKAPLGTHAIIGNHDWWEDDEAQAQRHGPTRTQRTFEAAGIPVLENDAVQLEHGGKPFWLTGTASIVALKTGRRGHFEGQEKLAETLKKVRDNAPVIHMAHEPDLFTEIPSRVSLTLSGHTHGGQVRLFGWSPVVPSAYDNRFAYGHIQEGGRHLVVSGGLGCSILPVRFGVPPEITLLALG